jgi:hypothetical protein
MLHRVGDVLHERPVAGDGGPQLEPDRNGAVGVRDDEHARWRVGQVWEVRRHENARRERDVA